MTETPYSEVVIRYNVCGVPFRGRILPLIAQQLGMASTKFNSMAVAKGSWFSEPSELLEIYIIEYRVVSTTC